MQFISTTKNKKKLQIEITHEQKNLHFFSFAFYALMLEYTKKGETFFFLQKQFFFYFIFFLQM